MPIDSNELLKQLFDQDQQYRRGRGLINRRHLLSDDPSFAERWRQEDYSRRQQVQGLINQQQLHSAGDYHRAAAIFQHGESLEDIEQAFAMAKQALALGQIPGLSLLPRTVDRRLIFIQKSQSSGKPITQWYGTNFAIDEGTIGLVFEAIGSVSDEERHYFGLVAIEQFVGKPLQEYYEACSTICDQLIQEWNQLESENQQQIIKKLLLAVDLISFLLPAL